MLSIVVLCKTFYTFSMRFILAQLFAFAFLLSGDGFAHAQSFPEFSLGDVIDTPSADPETGGQEFQIQTPLMRDILVLQEQINILDAMVQRQSEIQKIAQSYEEVGIAFRQPLPPEGTCRKIPFNMLCLYAYPEMEEHQPFIEQQKQRLVQKQQEAMEEAIASLRESIALSPMADPLETQAVLSDIEQDLGVEFEPEMILRESYYWSDIRCALGTCSALVVSSLDGNKRYRVKKGDKIEDEITVNDINVGGVQVTAEGETLYLSPLPIDGSNPGPNLVTMHEKGVISDLLEREMTASSARMKHTPNILHDLEDGAGSEANVLQNDLSGISEPPQAFFGQGEASQDEPLLGPTGLF